MKTAIYTNVATNETYKLMNVKNLAQAWKLASVVCKRNNWNEEMFSVDVKVKVI